MAERTIKLTGDLEAFVDAQVESGAYATPEDVVRAGLEALKGAAPDEPIAWSTTSEPLSLEALREMVKHGDADFAAGRVHTYENPGDLAKDIKREGRRLFREQQAKQVEQDVSNSVRKRDETLRKSTPGSRRTKIS